MTNATNSANDARRKADINSINKALLVYGTQHDGIYPIQATECTIGGGTTPCSVLASEMSELLPSLPTDPTSGRYYRYFTNSNGSSYTVYADLSSSQFALGSGQTCPTDWIDSGYGFCVMKYEAKNVGGIATSAATGTPWVSITQTEAIATCAALGNGAHLITNAEWTLLARNIESVPANWTGGSVGSGILKRGNVGIVDAGSYDGAGLDAGISNNLAELVLSNGQSIWHLSGNVWEWNNNTCIAGSGEGNWYNSGAWIEWNNSNLSDYEKTVSGPLGNFTSVNGVGRYYGCSVNGNAVLHGGNWGFGAGAGTFASDLTGSSADSFGSVGFRCAR